MGKDRKITVETRFSNGSISFKVNGRLVKLTKSTIDDIQDLIGENQVVRGDMVSVFIRYWLDSAECIAGPNHEQKQLWDNSERWEHTPYLFADEFISILGLLTNRDLTRLANFANEVEFRNSLAYRSWHRQNEGGGGFVNPEAHSRESTVIVDEMTWAEMTGQSDG